MNNVTNQNNTFCGRVPLNQTNLIQPHGVLLVLENGSGKILQASQNTEIVFGKTAEELFQTSFFDLLQPREVEECHSYFQNPVTGKLPFTFEGQQGRHLSFIQGGEKYSLLQIEARTINDRGSESFLSVYQKVKKVMAEVDACTSTEEVCRVAARELKVLSGFDKVMAYRFDEGWNGDVLAEEMEEGMESYLGLKFPASDIPPQARELYKKTPYRLIPNTDYEAVRLYPVLNPLTNSFTDLSDSNLRSVAGVHLEYLRNMKVAASMSTRILKNGQLWGLIACHHRTPFYLPFEICSVFELLSNYITAKIESQPDTALAAYQKNSGDLMARLVEKLYTQNSPQGYKELLPELLAADGVAVAHNGSFVTVGTVPGDRDLTDLVSWLQANEIDTLFHQPSLASVYEEAQSYAPKGSGLLALPVDGGKGNFILAFRGEAVQKIAWGGNPEEAVQFESDGKKYHPRESFKIWQQTVRLTAVPWKAEELEVADKVRHFFVRFRSSKN